MSGIKTFNWGIPAFRSASGFVTCPFAGQCATGCYAQQATYIWTPVKAAYERRLALAKSDSFVETIDAEIKRRKVKRLRVHDSGDFFSPAYRDAWLEIMQRNPYTVFYAYTKSIPLFQGVAIPSNFTLIYSEGGKLDHLIDHTTTRHSRVFPDAAALQAAGYADASQDDSQATGPNHRVGLIYHGYSSRAWTTGNERV